MEPASAFLILAAPPTTIGCSHRVRHAEAGTGCGGHLSLGPVTYLPQLQLALQAEQAVCCPGQLPGQCVIGLLHVLQLSPQEAVYLGEAHAPRWTKPTASCTGTS